MSKDMLNVVAASSKSGLSIPQVIAAIREFKLRAKRVNGQFWVRETDLLEFLNPGERQRPSRET